MPPSADAYSVAVGGTYKKVGACRREGTAFFFSSNVGDQARPSCHDMKSNEGKATMTESNRVRIGVELWPGGTPDYRTWRQAVLHGEELGAEAVFGYDHFHKRFVEIVDGSPQLDDEQPDVNNFKGWSALASWGEITSHRTRDGVD